MPLPTTEKTNKGLKLSSGPGPGLVSRDQSVIDDIVGLLGPRLQISSKALGDGEAGSGADASTGAGLWTTLGGAGLEICSSNTEYIFLVSSSVHEG